MTRPAPLDRFVARATVDVYRTGGIVARYCPPIVGHGFTTVASLGASLASVERRTMVTRNLRRVHGEDLGGVELAAKVARTFDSYGRYWYDSLRLPTMSTDAVERGFSIEGVEHLEAAMSDDTVGPVMALPHLGGWEWAAAWVTRVRGWELAAVVEALEPPELFEWFADLRRSFGINVIGLGPSAASEVAAAAAARQVVCLLSDRDLTGSGVPVTFFGEETTLPAGPAVMALRAGCRVIPAAVYLRGDGIRSDGVHAVIRPPLDTARRGKLRDDVARITQDLADELELLIRRAPEQWHLMQPNWPSDYRALGREPRPTGRPVVTSGEAL